MFISLLTLTGGVHYRLCLAEARYEEGKGKIPAPGQPRGWHSRVTVIPPGAGIGQGGPIQAAASLRYRDNGAGTITRLSTGLMWEKKHGLDVPLNFSHLPDADDTHTWSSFGTTMTWDELDDINKDGVEWPMRRAKAIREGRPHGAAIARGPQPGEGDPLPPTGGRTMRRLIGTLVVAGIMLLGAGRPTQVHANGIIYACVKNQSGGIRIVGPTDTCTANETALQWNVTGPSFLLTCPPDSVLVGTACIDTYEASVWEVPPANTGLIEQIKNGTATLADLTAGATQRGVAGYDYGTGCPSSGNGCVNVYAVSIPGVTPSAFITWFQAAAAARNSGKRLPTNAEWTAAALGTPDPGESPGSEDCNTHSSPDLTGARMNCKSDVGAFDMVGNLWEWVADWVPFSTACPGWGGFSDDFMCLAGASTTGGPGALFRGGNFTNGSNAGVFAVYGLNSPSFANISLGFRAAR